MSTPVVDCVAPDRSPAELAALRRALATGRGPLRRSAERYSLLAGETRLKILTLLEYAGELCVCDLATVLGMTPGAVSQHLARLRTGSLATARRDGMTCYYSCADRSQWSPATPVLVVEED